MCERGKLSRLQLTSPKKDYNPVIKIFVQIKGLTYKRKS